MRVAGMIQDSIVDGPGLRFVVFAQGCRKNCEGCHNPESQSFTGGNEFSVDEIITEMYSNPLTDGLTLSGGEPFLQAGECSTLASAAKKRGLNVWVYSGYTLEELTAAAESDSAVGKLLGIADVLVDGRFILAERSLQLKWRGSRNQRVLDLPKSLASGEAVLLF